MAGQDPIWASSRARTSTRPNCQVLRPDVVMLDDVYSAYWRLVFQLELPAE